jgi:hypothetical protein
METERLRFANAALASFLASTPAITCAQTDSNRADVAGSGRNTFDGLEEITVTARRKEENVMTTPVTVTPLSASALETRSVFEARDLQAQVPTLSVNPTTAFGQPQFTLNGIRSEFPTGITINGPSVATYINEVPQNKEHSELFVRRHPPGRRRNSDRRLVACRHYEQSSVGHPARNRARAGFRRNGPT